MPRIMIDTTERASDDETEFRLGIEDLLDFEAEEATRESEFRIGDLAREFGVTLRTLRFYEDRGLLAPHRAGTTRIYSRRDRMRLRLVLIGKALGFSLTEAKQMIDIYYQPDGQRKQLKVALERFEQQRRILEEQRREIDESLEAMRVTTQAVQNRLASLK